MRVQAKIEESRVLRQIIQDKHHPLSVIREAISNSWDAGSRHCHVTISSGGERKIDLEFRDDGRGISREEFTYFFGAGFANKEETEFIGHKGLGTKLFFNSNRLTVESKTIRGEAHRGIMESPREVLERGALPEYTLERADLSGFPHESGTRIRIAGVPGSLRSPFFSRDYLKAYIQWFTAAGRISATLGRGEERDFDVDLERRLANGDVYTCSVNSHPLPETGAGEQANYETFARRFSPFSFEVTNDDGEVLGTAEVAGSIVGPNAHLVTDRRIKKRFKGIFVGTRYILIKNVSEEVFGGTGEWQNLHVVVNCNELQPSLNREDFVGASPGSLYAELIRSLRRFARSTMRGSRFSYRGRVIEQSSDFAGRVFSQFQRRRVSQRTGLDKAERIVRIFAMSRGRHLPDIFGGGPVLRPHDSTGVLLAFQALLTLTSLRDVNSMTEYRVLGTAEDAKAVFLQVRENGEWGTPRFYRSSYQPAVGEIENLFASDAYDGLICWKIADDESSIRTELRNRIILVSKLIDAMEP